MYLPSELTIQEMYKDYLEKTTEETISYVSHIRILKELHIWFAKLGEEEYEVCESHKLYLLQTPNSESDRKKESMFKASNAVSSDKKKYISVDMQKVILLPRFPGFKLNLFT